VTLANGRIGISGSVLFAFNSDRCSPRAGSAAAEPGRAAGRLPGFRDELLMVSGFTDDRQVREGGNRRFADNWELSAQRALTVTRALIDDGLPSHRSSPPPSGRAAGGLERRRRRARA
jgi:flagellar motor protein MotB